MNRDIVITHLEMTDPSQAVPVTGEPRLEIRRAETPCPELNCFFYCAVGADWWWWVRRSWTQQQWTEYVSRPELETWVGYRSGTPAGYFELEHQTDRQVELKQFGLLPPFVGQGLGAELLAGAIERAWRQQPRRVWVHTCNLDHPRALPNYQARGFRIFETEERVEQLPEQPPRFWPAEGG